MVAQPVSPFVLKDVVFQVADDDFAAHVSQVEFAPSASLVTWKGLTPDSTFSESTSATWSANVAYAQDWSETGFSRYLYEHEGDTVHVVFKPITGTGPSFEADVIITPGAIGGTVDTVAVGSVTLGLKSRPTLLPAVVV